MPSPWYLGTSGAKTIEPPPCRSQIADGRIYHSPPYTGTQILICFPGSSFNEVPTSAVSKAGPGHQTSRIPLHAVWGLGAGFASLGLGARVAENNGPNTHRHQAPVARSTSRTKGLPEGLQWRRLRPEPGHDDSKGHILKSWKPNPHSGDILRDHLGLPA